ncbi:MAG: ribosome biogenesis GTPase Der [Gammaproteobacteria bacterium]|nr:ribosome biogenesis GTPase Der [Gammaproteobacteria bacterium]
MIPVVAIVGRPNVGKSTLFNCLTQSRNALVSDFPGMTRDRQYGQADFDGHRFIVIDTAGIGDDIEELDKLSIQQSIQAVRESDIVLFVVDGRAGMTSADQIVADKLRSLNKVVHLVVNKTEGLEHEMVTADFYRVGFGDPYSIAASHKSGITELIHDIFRTPEADVTEDDAETGIKLAIIGKPNVGKSTLINRMLGEERVIVFDQPGTTRDSIFIPLERHDQKYTLIDTAGIRRRGKIFEATEKFSVVKTLQAIESANVVLFVIDARDGASEQDLKLLGFIIDSGKALVLAVNKWDGMTPAERETTKVTVDRRLHFVDFARIHYISALHGSGVGNLFDSINEAYESANRKLSTPMLNKILREAVLAHNPPLVHGRRVKLRYAHTGGHNPPRIIIHGNQVNSLPDAYRRYLSNTYQQRLKLVGTPVRIEFKTGDNPFRENKNVLTEHQIKKKKRLMRHVKR